MMEFMRSYDITTSENSLQTMGKGVTLPTWAVIAGGVLFIGGMVTVGLCVFYLAPPPPGSEGSDLTTSGMSTTALPTTATRPPGDVNYRLPRSLNPIHYDLRLLPVIEEGNFTIDGHVKIEIECIEETDLIVLHINDMLVNVNTIKVEGSGITSPTDMVMHTQYDDLTQFFTVHLKAKLKKQSTYTVSMSYIANLNDIMAGFYRSSYLDQEGKKKYIATTQFQPTDARRAFPCFDEPNFKAKFSVTLGRKKGMTSMSNMPINRTEQHPEKSDYEWDIYGESVTMSTYLVAFVISDFTKNVALPAGKTEVAVWSRPGSEKQTKYAVEVTPKILTYLEDFFKILYPLPKQDMIAIPDFSAGAMENWGLITYRETAVLYEEGVSSAKNKQRVAVVIAHELAHQWFGDLVTTDWWDLIWLNEGFATYMEFKGVDHVAPTMRMAQQFLSEATHYVMQLDGLNSSHPMIMSVNNPDEVNELFDPISYEKSGAVIRMTEDMLSLPVMTEGLTAYLTNRSYSTATADDLWAFLNDAAVKNAVDLGGMSVKQILDTWSLQKNFPVVTVERSPTNAADLVVSQKRFISVPYEGAEESYWYVPLTFTQSFDGSSKLERRWLANVSTTTTFEGILAKPAEWVICNYEVFGYYRVNYDDSNWKLLIAQLNTDHEKIGIMNRAQIIDDTMNLASSGLKDYDLALDATKYLTKEKEWLPWETADNNFERLVNLLGGTEVEPMLGQYIQSLVLPLYGELTFDEEASDEHLKLYLRAIVVATACGTDYPSCVDNAKSTFDAWKQNPNDATLISPNLKGVITCTAVRRGDVTEFDFLEMRYRTTNVASEKDQLLSAMMCTRDVILLRRILKWTITEGSPIRKQDAALVYRGLATNAIGRTLGFGFIQDNWEAIKEYNGGYLVATEWVKALSKFYNKQSELAELKAFRNEKQPQLGTTRTLDQAIEQTQVNVQWVEKYYSDIKQWFDALTKIVG